MTTEAKTETKKTISEELRTKAKWLERLLEFGYQGTEVGEDEHLLQKQYTISREKFSELLNLAEAATILWNNNLHQLSRVFQYLKEEKPDMTIRELNEILEDSERFQRIEKFLPCESEDNIGLFVSSLVADLYAIRDVQNCQAICEF